MLSNTSIDHFTKKAISNLIKVAGLALAAELKEIKKADKAAFNDNK